MNVKRTKFTFKCNLLRIALFSLAFHAGLLIAAEPLTIEKKNEAKVKKAEQKVDVDEKSTSDRKDFYMNREFAVNELLLKQAKDARDKEDFETARKLYERVLGFSPNDQYALIGLTALEREVLQSKKISTAQESFNANKFSEANTLVREVLLENPQHKKALTLRNQLSEKLDESASTIPQLKGRFNKPVTLELRDANIKMVFDALSRDTGINFILDKDVRPDSKANIYVKNMPIEDAIDTVISSNGLEKKVISENTVIIYPSNQQKNKAYQELLIRNFYLNNTSAKDVAALLKSLIKTKDVYVYERLNMLVMRDTPEVIHLAEKLVASIDLEDPEVMLEIEVLEVSRNRLQQLGIVFPNQISVISETTPLNLKDLKNINSSAIGISPNPAINFKKTDGDINLLSNPRIRVKNNEKAKILVGDKIPVITTTSTANVGISENVTYVDVGLKLDVEPHITLDNFVNIKLGLEVSTLGDKTVTKNGATVYAIGTRNTQTALRLKDGETQILAGLILDDERKTVSKLPGLGDIPLLGRLFSDNDSKNNKTEIVLAITPRVLGNILLPKSQQSEYWSGTENQLSDKFKKSVPTDVSNAPSSNNAFDRLLEQRRLREIELNGQAAPEAGALPIDPAMIPPLPVISPPAVTPNQAPSDATPVQGVFNAP